MPCRPRHPAAAIPRVALLVETSLASGRDILRGIARYVREHGPCRSITRRTASRRGSPAGWRGGTATASSCGCNPPRSPRGSRPRAFPPWMCSGWWRTPGCRWCMWTTGPWPPWPPNILRERGFRHFAYFGICGENWSTRRRESFRRAVGTRRGGLAVCELPRRSMESRDWERQENALADWVRALPKPTGIMVCSDQVGQHLLEACRRAAGGSRRRRCGGSRQRRTALRGLSPAVVLGQRGPPGVRGGRAPEPDV